MKLTQQQINRLYKFTRQHFVEWYDLQTELVDHLANGIESQWIKNPNIDFENALQTEFKKFGVFGFMNVVEKRQKTLSKRYLKIMFGFIKEWFKLPKILATITFTYILFLLLSSKYGLYSYFGILIIASVVIFIKIFKMRKTFNAKEKATGRKWLFEEMIFKTTSANVFVFLGNMIQVHNLADANSYWENGFLAIITILMFLMANITLNIIPKNAENYLKQVYPEYGLV